MISHVLEAAVLVASAPVLAASAYLLALTLLSRRPVAPAPRGPDLRFDVLVPAHDEERDLAETVRGLGRLEWPAGRRRTLVIADNCTDSTAALAEEAGALVVVRHCPDLRGKGRALALGVERSLADGVADAVAVVDADTAVDRGLLRAFATRIALGAQAVQADYAVRNPDDGWRTRLMALAFTLFHRVRSLGREWLGLSCGLRGNGMCFTTRALQEVPYAAFSLVEDVEYGLLLGESGHRVWYADEASVDGEMVASGPASASQRIRWEEGRRALRPRALRMLARAISRRDGIAAELALDVLVPSLARLFASTALGLVAAAALAAATDRPIAALLPFAASAALLSVYVLRGWQLSGTRLAGLRALACAPAYLGWKLLLRLSGATHGPGWVRTARRGEAR